LLCLFITFHLTDTDDKQPQVGDLRSELDNLYEQDDDNHILSRFDIDSKYYDVEQLQFYTECESSFKYNTLHLNIQGLRSSFENLKHLLHKLELNNIHIDFILLCETFLHGTQNQDYHCNIEGYQLVCKNRSTRSKGGVAIYVNNKHHFSLRDDLSTFVEGEYESIFIEITSTPNNAIIGEIYRIPNTPARLSVNRFEDTIAKLINYNSHDIIIGSDMNFDFIKMNEHKHTADLFENFISSGLIPVITRPTRITHSTASVIDNIYIKLHQTHIKSGIITTKISDHLPIFAFYGKISKKKQDSIIIKSRKLNDANIVKIRYILERYDWTILTGLDANSAYNKFLSILTNAIDKIAPERNIKLSPKHIIREPWVTKGVLKSSATLDKLYKKSLNKG